MKLAIIAFALLGAVLASPIQQMPRADTLAERFAPAWHGQALTQWQQYALQQALGIGRAGTPAERAGGE